LYVNVELDDIFEILFIFSAASLAQWSVSWFWLGRARVRSPLTAIFLKNFYFGESK